jgi:hypothetical protein
MVRRGFLSDGMWIWDGRRKGGEPGIGGVRINSPSGLDHEDTQLTPLIQLITLDSFSKGIIIVAIS